MKQYQYKVYSASGAFLTNWNEVISEPNFNQEINVAGGQMVVSLARNAGDYGEGTDIDFGYIVKVFCYNDLSPDGFVVFIGFISSYTPVYAENRVEVILLSQGEDLAKFMLQDSVVIDSHGLGGVNFGFTPIGGNVPLGGFYGNTYTINATVASGCISLGIIDVGSIEGLPEVVTTFTIKRGGTTLFSKDYSPNELTPFGGPFDTYFARLTFPESIPVTPGEVLTITLTIPTGSPLYSLILKGSTAGTGAGWRGWSTDGTTEISFLSDDPSDILKGIIDRYREMGGIINYDATSIEQTGTVVSYTFNANTVIEGINKCLELAPAGWYWYVDYATNLIHFHPEDNTPTHTFSLEKDILDLNIEKRIEDLVNTIYFTGGEVSPGAVLYKKYTVDESIKKYGIKAMKYIDQRVTVAATAATISNAILEKKSEPELRATISILDVCGGGYDIESIKVGDIVSIRNVSQKVGLSSWDASRWDEDYWDFNIQNLSSLQMQIQKRSYSPDRVELFASTIALDVNKRIEDINRNLETLQTLNNSPVPN